MSFTSDTRPQPTRAYTTMPTRAAISTVDPVAAVGKMARNGATMASVKL